MPDALHLLLGRTSVLGVSPSVPARPDGRRVDVRDVLAEIAAADGGLARRIELVGDDVQLGHERLDLLLVERLEIARPVVLVAQSPEAVSYTHLTLPTI